MVKSNYIGELLTHSIPPVRTIPREVRLEVNVSQTKLGNQIKQLQLTPQEKEMIIACLLGDGTLSKSGKHYRLRIEHNAKHGEYVEWKCNLLKRICISKIQYVNSHSSFRFGTVAILTLPI